MKAFVCLLCAFCFAVQPALAADPAPPAAQSTASAEAPELAKLRDALKVLESDPAAAADAYVVIYQVFDKGEQLARAGDAQNAKVHYDAVLAALQALRKRAPEWNPSIVQFRISRVEERLAALNHER